MWALGRDPQYVVARVETDRRAEVGYADRQLRVRIAAELVGASSWTTRETILTAAEVTAAEARVVTRPRTHRTRRWCACAGPHEVPRA